MKGPIAGANEMLGDGTGCTGSSVEAARAEAPASAHGCICACLGKCYQSRKGKRVWWMTGRIPENPFAHLQIDTQKALDRACGLKWDIKIRCGET